MTLQETALSEAVLLHRRDDATGQYGLRSGSGAVGVGAVRSLPHLYGSLACHAAPGPPPPAQLPGGMGALY